MTVAPHSRVRKLFRRAASAEVRFSVPVSRTLLARTMVQCEPPLAPEKGSNTQNTVILMVVYSFIPFACVSDCRHEMLPMETSSI